MPLSPSFVLALVDRLLLQLTMDKGRSRRNTRLERKMHCVMVNGTVSVVSERQLHDPLFGLNYISPSSPEYILFRTNIRLKC